MSLIILPGSMVSLVVLDGNRGLLLDTFINVKNDEIIRKLKVGKFSIMSDTITGNVQQKVMVMVSFL